MGINIADKLKKLRLGRNLTQKEVSEYVNLSKQAISNIELGNRSGITYGLQQLLSFYGYEIALVKKRDHISIKNKSVWKFETDDLFREPNEIFNYYIDDLEHPTGFNFEKHYENDKSLLSRNPPSKGKYEG